MVGGILVLESCVSALVLGLIRLEGVAVAAAAALGDATFAATLFCFEGSIVAIAARPIC